MPSLEEMGRITNNIIEVLTRLDIDMHKYPETSKEYALRMHGISSILTKVEHDFDEELLMWVLITFENRIGHSLPLDSKIVKKLIQKGCSIKKVHSICQYKK